jgi:LuxR family maltose regulon positive regulatory protein
MILACWSPVWYTSWEEQQRLWKEHRHREGPMSRVPLHALIWSQDQGCYALYTQDRLVQQVQPGDEAAWLVWLRKATSFAFHGASGSLNVYLEARSPGGQYWYAYHTSRGRTRKRYLGRTETLSLARLEETARALGSGQQPAQALDPGMLVLVSRLAPPRLPNALVERARLLTMLDGALSTPLTLLSAPAGFGKTTLLATWASRRKSQVAWLSLSEMDNGPSRFWVALIAALRRCPSLTPHVGDSVVARLESPQPPPLSACLSVLLQELEGRSIHPVPVVLVMDDYQVISDPTIHEGLAFFLEHLPAHLHVILSSRVDPDLPLARLRVRGHLTEIRMDELRFEEGEASQYLGHMLSSTPSAEEVSQLTNRTEGWIAGLQLAALAMQKHKDRAAFLQAFSGSQRHLLDYAQEEILARLPTHVRDFLLHSAILPQMSASICQAITAAPTQAASQQMLAWLERANLFLIPLDEERHSYRLHELFREALLSVLHTTHPELVPLLHHRAAAFYEAEGQWAEAITHALAGADYSTAARLMEQTVEQFWLRGEAETMARWVLALPQPLVRQHARLTLTTALYLLNTVTHTTRERRTRVHQQAQRLMERVETALLPHADETGSQPSATRGGAGATLSSGDREALAAEDAVLHRRLRLLHAEMASYKAIASGENERLSALYQEIQALDQDEEVIWHIFPLFCRVVLHYTIRQEGAELLPWLLEAKEQESRKAPPFAIIRIRYWVALSHVEAGHLRLASQESLAALDLIVQRAGYAVLTGYFESVLVRVFYQWNRLEEAQNHLQTLLHDAAAWQHLDLLGWGYAELLQIALATADQSLAELALHEVLHLVQRERFGFYPGWLPTLRAQWWLAQGQMKEASDWAAGLVFPEGTWERGAYDAFPVVMRVYFAQNRFREALSLLEYFRVHLDRPANIRITITYLAQLLVALHQVGKRDQAREIAARLFALTEPEGYIRVYLDEGELMREALQALLISHSKPHEFAASTMTYIAKLLATFEQVQPGASSSLEVTKTPGPAPSLYGKASALPFMPAIVLTRREQEVLRLLAAGASNQEIAQALVISLETAKKHVSNLLGKLGASSRTQAVALARTRSLL